MTIEKNSLCQNKILNRLLNPFLKFLNKINELKYRVLNINLKKKTT